MLILYSLVCAIHTKRTEVSTFFTDIPKESHMVLDKGGYSNICQWDDLICKWMLIENFLHGGYLAKHFISTTCYFSCYFSFFFIQITFSFILHIDCILPSVLSSQFLSPASIPSTPSSSYSSSISIQKGLYEPGSDDEGSHRDSWPDLSSWELMDFGPPVRESLWDQPRPYAYVW